MTSSAWPPTFKTRAPIRWNQLGAPLCPHADRLEAWLGLAIDADAAQVWGRLSVPHPDHELDKQIAAIALVNDLTVVTRNTADFAGARVRLVDPFHPASAGP